MKVYILLDRSGSMNSPVTGLAREWKPVSSAHLSITKTLWESSIEAINAYVKKLKSRDKIQLALFDSPSIGLSYEVVRDSTKKEWIPFDYRTYSPRGNTPLYDAMGYIISRMESDKSKKSILVVVTDGFENNSKEFTLAAIKAKLETFKEKNWQVLMLGANFDRIGEVGASFGLNDCQTISIRGQNMSATMSTLATYSTSYATTGALMSFTAEDKKRAAKE